MRLSVLGGVGAWPSAGQACSGFLVEHEGFRLVLDVGYATVPRLLSRVAPEAVDAVFVTHGHPDHCADLNPLLRSRVLGGGTPPPLPVYAPAHALDAVLALDSPTMLAGSFTLHELDGGDRLEVGPFTLETRWLPHWVPNLGVRVSAGGTTLAYTGDGGPGTETVELARDADLLVAEATYVDDVPSGSVGYLTSAGDAGRQAEAAGVARLMLTHLWPGTDPGRALAVAGTTFTGALGVAVSGESLVVAGR